MKKYLILFALLFPITLLSQEFGQGTNTKAKVMPDTTSKSKKLGKIVLLSSDTTLYIDTGEKFIEIALEGGTISFSTVNVDSIAEYTLGHGVSIGSNLQTFADVIFNQTTNEKFTIVDSDGDTVFAFVPDATYPTFYIMDDLHADSILFYHDGTDFQIVPDAGTGLINFDSNTLIIDNTNNRVGIGTASPINKLDVRGGANIYTNQDSIKLWTSKLTGGDVDADSGMTILPNGNVGIGTASPLSQTDISKTGIGVTQSDAYGLRLSNTTAAAVGAQQYSPPFIWQGNGWKTDATAASQSVEFMSYVRPVQGASAPTGYLDFVSSINGESYSSTPIMSIGSNGKIGIGIANNSIYTLYVNGSLKADSYLCTPLVIANGTTFYIRNNSGTQKWLDCFASGDVQFINNSVYIDSSTGFVGFNDVTPTAPIDITRSGEAIRVYGVAPYLSVINSGDGFQSMMGSYNGYTAFGAISNGYTVIRANNTQIGRFNTDGSFSIGRSTIATDQVVGSLSIVSDADVNASETTTETFGLALTTSADPTLAYWKFTSSQASGFMFDKATGDTPGGDDSVSDAGTIDVTGHSYLRIVGGDADATNVSIEDGSFDGQVLELQGTSDSNLVTITDGNNVELAGGVNFSMGKGDILGVRWDAGDSTWYERYRSDN